MKKISKLLESISLGKLEIENEEFTKYRKVVTETLLRLYRDYTKIGNANFVARQSFDSPKRIKSIINYSNTNIMLAKWIVRNFKITSFDELLDFVITKASDLFLPEGSYFEEVIKILKITEEIGIKNELAACGVMSDVISEKLGRKIDVLRTETDSAEDIFYGIDIFFDLDGKRYTCQVKPLKNIYLKDSEFVIQSSGSIKEYKTHYWLFIDVNNYTQELKWALFQNKEPIINDVILRFKKENLVSTSVSQLMI